MVTECNKIPLGYQLRLVVEGRMNQCLRTMSDLVITELMRKEMVLEALVYSPFNHLMWLVAQEVYLNIYMYEDRDSLLQLMVI